MYSRYRDSEDVVHISGPSIAVNSGLCGNNDALESTSDECDCNVCLAIVRFVKSNGRNE